jgi:hypothetical protein
MKPPTAYVLANPQDSMRVLMVSRSPLPSVLRHIEVEVPMSADDFSTISVALLRSEAVYL